MPNSVHVRERKEKNYREHAAFLTVKNFIFLLFRSFRDEDSQGIEGMY